PLPLGSNPTRPQRTHAVSSLPPTNPPPLSGLHTAPDPSSSMAADLGAPTPANPEGADDDVYCCCSGSDGEPADAAMVRWGAAAVVVKGRRKRGAVVELLSSSGGTVPPHLSSPPPPSPPAQLTECLTPLIGMMPCMDYLTNLTVLAPPAECYDGLKSIIRDAPICLCHGMTGDMNDIMPLPIDPIRMIILPLACGAMLPLQTLFSCITQQVPPMAVPVPANPPASPIR
uniref:Bifunctional inhibitor/plant lipid transfer protein/seed storage helical domain-containing protein n=1 Tax=Setaria italica TaxID=4555 RepID=K3YYN1_SETIT